MGFKSVGKILKDQRELRNLTQAQVAKLLGYKSAQFVSNWERGLAFPPIKHVKKICRLYGMDINEFSGNFKIAVIDQFVLSTSKQFKKAGLE